jgi:hypothetical protein
MSQMKDPVNFYEVDELPHGVIIMPERRLLIAILAQAYNDYHDDSLRLDLAAQQERKATGAPPGHYARNRLVALKAWFASNETHPFSFLWVCQHVTTNWESLAVKMRDALTKPKNTVFLHKYGRFWAYAQRQNLLKKTSLVLP